MKRRFSLVLLSYAIILSSCSALKISSSSTIKDLPQNYVEMSRYAETLDGFVREEGQEIDSLFRIVLKDCNVPVARADSIKEKAKLFKHAKTLMDKIIAIDTHCDFPEGRYYHPEDSCDFGASRSNCCYSLEKMRQGHISAVCMAVWMRPVFDGQLDPRSIAAGPDSLWKFVDSMETHFAKYRDYCGIARNYKEARELKKQGKKIIMYALENAHWIGNDISNIKKLADKGFVYITLSHQKDNQICNSCTRSRDENAGLSDFGREVVKEMNRLGILIDLSHTSIGTQREVLELSRAPVIYTHSCCSAIYDNPRNVDDETLRLLAKNGGVIQIMLLQSFMASKENRRKIGIDDMVKHICHAVEVAGIDHVGIGTDFDGGGHGIGFEGANDAINLTMKLIEKGFSDREITKIWEGNFFRVLSEVRNNM